MDDLGDVLIAGTGPTAVQTAVLIGRLRGEIGIVGRESDRSATFFSALAADAGLVRAEVQNEKHRGAAGRQRISRWFGDHRSVTGTWSTLVLTVTADAYVPVLEQLDPDVLRGIEQVVLMSPTMGSGLLVGGLLRDRGISAEVISFSSYLGDTRWTDGSPGPSVLTAGLKRRVYAASTRPSSPGLGRLQELYGSIGVSLEILGAPLEAESRNISLYVHPPLCMNDMSLRSVFEATGPMTYLYKLYPEGPITPTLIRTMVALWRELSAVVAAMGGSGVNLLDMMLGDGYPVRPESIDAAEIVGFDHLPTIHQEYLVYVRYASLLIDPFSAPGPDGRYFDFSAIPIRPIFQTDAGTWEIPRMPKEDYYRTGMIQQIAHHLQVPCPTVDSLLYAYESARDRAVGRLSHEPLTEAFTAGISAGDRDLICAAIGDRT